jgi:hypothetical protein
MKWVQLLIGQTSSIPIPIPTTPQFMIHKQASVFKPLLTIAISAHMTPLDHISSIVFVLGRCLNMYVNLESNLVWVTLASYSSLACNIKTFNYYFAILGEKLNEPMEGQLILYTILHWFWLNSYQATYSKRCIYLTRSILRCNPLSMPTRPNNS